MESKLYVGNLPYGATEDSIREFFGTAGSVRSVKIIMDRDTGRSKGFGFVEMETGDDAERAIRELNGKEFQGRSLRINEAHQGTGGGGGGGGGGERRGGGGGGFRSHMGGGGGRHSR